jgi:hypothetical protein
MGSVLNENGGVTKRCYVGSLENARLSAGRIPVWLRDRRPCGSCFLCPRRDIPLIRQKLGTKLNHQACQVGGGGGPSLSDIGLRRLRRYLRECQCGDKR